MDHPLSRMTTKTGHGTAPLQNNRVIAQQTQENILPTEDIKEFLYLMVDMKHLEHRTTFHIQTPAETNKTITLGSASPPPERHGNQILHSMKTESNKTPKLLEW